jgi:hypothetical protein
MRVTCRFGMQSAVIAMLPVLAMLVGIAEIKAITCTPGLASNAYCETAHYELATLPPGPRCVETPNVCSLAQNTVCTGVYWDNAIAGRCPTNPEGTTGDCILNGAVTNVTIYKRSAGCKFDAAGTPGSCNCKGTAMVDPVTGQTITDNKEVCNCVPG